VIGTRAGGIPDIVEDGVNGLLVLPENSPALAAALVRVLEDRGLQQRLAEGAREGAAAWVQTPEQYADRVRDLVVRVAARS
jgi:glycosyltransferase involved in cell wall biosynthesis